MEYFKKYTMTHIKYWWIYIFSLFTSLFGLLFVFMVTGRYLAMIGVTSNINFIVSSLVGSLIGSAPIFYINYVVSKDLKVNNKKQLFITGLSHLVTIVVYFLLFAVALYWLVIDFRE